MIVTWCAVELGLEALRQLPLHLCGVLNPVLHHSWVGLTCDSSVTVCPVWEEPLARLTRLLSANTEWDRPQVPTCSTGISGYWENMDLMDRVSKYEGLLSILHKCFPYTTILVHSLCMIPEIMCSCYNAKWFFFLYSLHIIHTIIPKFEDNHKSKYSILSSLLHKKK